MVAPIAAVMDLAMLDRLAVDIKSEFVAEGDLPVVADPLFELGFRFLIKYIRLEQAEYFSSVSGVTEFPGPHFLTPTPLTRDDVAAVLNLPPLDDPVRGLLLVPELLSGLRGPRRIRGGLTVEYVCDDFCLDAIVDPKWGILL